MGELRDLLQLLAYAAQLGDRKRLEELSHEIEERYIYDRDNAWSNGFAAGKKAKKKTK